MEKEKPKKKPNKIAFYIAIDDFNFQEIRGAWYSEVPAEIYSDRRIEPNELIGVTIKKIIRTDDGIIIFYGERGE
jgi:hypothetical protein